MHLGATTRNGGRQPGIGHSLRRNDDIYRLRQIDAPEHNARIRRGRPKSQLDPLATLQAHADSLGQGFKGSLSQHDAILVGARATRGTGAEWRCSVRPLALTPALSQKVFYKETETATRLILPLPGALPI